MPATTETMQSYLRDFDFAGIFTQALGWEHHQIRLVIPVDGVTYTLRAVGHKRGLVAFVCDPGPDGAIPDRRTRAKIDRQVAKSVHEHLIVFGDAARTTQIWQWARREHGKPTAFHEERFDVGQSGARLLQKLQVIRFSLEEEERTTLPDVTGRVRQAFDVDRVTKRFYERFQTEHSAFLTFIKGIQDEGDCRRYASLMLNRLMFVYFIQKQGFLDGDQNYLQHRLATTRARRGDGRFYSFYRHFLLRLFHEGLGQQSATRDPELDALLGEVPYLNGGLFDVHELEHDNPDIQIADEAFERLFAFFERYSWHLDDRPLRADDEINPDVLGYIFEKYINQKQMGAYYTKEDITEYIAKNTIVPFLFDAAAKEAAGALAPDGYVWRLLRENPDRYIYPAVRKGVIADGEVVPLPDEIAAGLTDVTKRGGWNRPAPEPYALPTETWREHVARRTRCLDLRAKLEAGKVTAINDLVTLNLDIRQFAQDAIQYCEGSDLLRAFYRAVSRVTVLDPTCGSGAFLFAALNVLQPLYEACLERMQGFLDDLDRSGEPHRPEKLSDFRKTLEEVARHPNREYFVLKQIILDNLYGVDIMEEAVEICKLRLFLKLVAQVERREQIEPLPDIDFNIRAGNTLVGFARYAEAEMDVGGRLDFSNTLKIVKRDALEIDSLSDRFREQQTTYGGTVTAEDKAELRRRLRGLEARLNSYLAEQYGVRASNSDAFRDWRKSYQPFYWFVDFHHIMEKGGFASSSAIRRGKNTRQSGRTTRCGTTSPRAAATSMAYAPSAHSISSPQTAGSASSCNSRSPTLPGWAS